MWDPYINSTRDHLEDADEKIVFDRYHLMKYVTGAVDTVHKRRTRLSPLPETRASLGPSTSGSTRRRTSPSAIRTASPS